MRDLTAADLRAYIARVFDLVVVLRRLRSGRRIVHPVAALDGLTADSRLRAQRRVPRRAGRQPANHRLVARPRLASVGTAGGAHGIGGSGMDLTLVGAWPPASPSSAASWPSFPTATGQPWRRRRTAFSLPPARSAARELLAQARLEVSPRGFVALAVAAPLLLAAVGLAPVAGDGPPSAPLIGLFLPRWYVRWLVGGEARAADDDAPRVLRAMVARAAAGGTYPELFAAAAEAARHRWVRADLEELLGRYYANEPPTEALALIRTRQAGRNLRLYTTRCTCCSPPTSPRSAAAQVLAGLGEAARTNQSIARAAVAESRGLRIQAADPGRRSSRSCSATCCSPAPTWWRQ